MDKQYFTNTRIDIRVNPLSEDITEEDVLNADQVLILYCMPNKTGGEWVGEKFGSSIKYVTQTTDVPTVGGVGTWKLQGCIVKDGVRKPGNVAFLTLKKPLN